MLVLFKCSLIELSKLYLSKKICIRVKETNQTNILFIDETTKNYLDLAKITTIRRLPVESQLDCLNFPDRTVCQITEALSRLIMCFQK